MQFKFFFPLALLLGSMSLVFAENQIPFIVAKLPETQALWNYLERRGHLPGKFVEDGLQGLPTDPWHSFLKRRGNEIIDYYGPAPSLLLSSNTLLTMTTVPDTFLMRFDPSDDSSGFPGTKQKPLSDNFASSLKKFVNSPKTEMDPYLTSRVPSHIGRRIITEYAYYLDKNPHLVAVNEYHRLPDTAEALLLK
ncbi:uncharacterized protein UTRI_03312 [Ustilago trichophora]|uniref:Uncharacterized protein n=1 Tax=Ustilago trichophora TaxID=86804 RepID=A0A5C3E8K3_9BASI|nr:uncharacterized protein UTRI_03312 [Ustilago trichophora]